MIFQNPKSKFPLLLLLSMAILSVSCLDPDAAKEKLSQLGIDYNAASFLSRVRTGDQIAVGLFLAAGMNPETAENGRTALMLAAARGYVPIAEMLIYDGAGVNAQDSSGLTPLMMASMFGHADAVKLLIHEGAGVNAQNQYGRTALTIAALEGHSDAIRVLIAKGADVNLKDKVGMTALIWAALEGRTRTLDLLIDHGADVNARDENGRTALIFAAWKGHLETVQFLLRNGADLSAKDSPFGGNAMVWAAMGNHPDIVEILRTQPVPSRN